VWTFNQGYFIRSSIYHTKHLTIHFSVGGIETNQLMDCGHFVNVTIKCRSDFRERNRKDADEKIVFLRGITGSHAVVCS